MEVLSECCLLSYMARVENRLSFLFRLINIINVQTLTQVRTRKHSKHGSGGPLTVTTHTAEFTSDPLQGGTGGY